MKDSHLLLEQQSFISTNDQSFKLYFILVTYLTHLYFSSEKCDIRI